MLAEMVIRSYLNIHAQYRMVRMMESWLHIHTWEATKFYYKYRRSQNNVQLLYKSREVARDSIEYQDKIFLGHKQMNLEHLQNIHKKKVL